MTRLRVKGYIGRRLRRHLSKIFHGLLENIAIEKRNHALIQRVRSRWQNVCVFKTFNAWASDFHETKRQRKLMQRFKQRWLNMSIARAYDAWISCVAERKRLRQTMTVTLNRLKSASLMRAITSWRSCVAPADAPLDVLRYAIFSCSSWSWGYFNAYRAAATQAEPLDFWLHVGDYFYECRRGGPKPAPRRRRRRD